MLPGKLKMIKRLLIVLWLESELLEHGFKHQLEKSKEKGDLWQAFAQLSACVDKFWTNWMCGKLTVMFCDAEEVMDERQRKKDERRENTNSRLVSGKVASLWEGVDMAKDEVMAPFTTEPKTVRNQKRMPRPVQLGNWGQTNCCHMECHLVTGGTGIEVVRQEKKLYKLYFIT